MTTEQIPSADEAHVMRSNSSVKGQQEDFELDYGWKYPD